MPMSPAERAFLHSASRDESHARPMPHARDSSPEMGPAYPLPLPAHVRKMSEGGVVTHSCLHCGGDVDEKGYATSSLYDESAEPDYAAKGEDQVPPQEDVEAQFTKAIRGNR